MFSNGRKLASETREATVTLPARMSSSAIRQSSGRVPNDDFSSTSLVIQSEGRICHIVDRELLVTPVDSCSHKSHSSFLGFLDVSDDSRCIVGASFLKLGFYIGNYLMIKCHCSKVPQS